MPLISTSALSPAPYGTDLRRSLQRRYNPEKLRRQMAPRILLQICRRCCKECQGRRPRSSPWHPDSPPGHYSRSYALRIFIGYQHRSHGRERSCRIFQPSGCTRGRTRCRPLHTSSGQQCSQSHGEIISCFILLKNRNAQGVFLFFS